MSEDLSPAESTPVPPAAESAHPLSRLDAAAARGDIRWPADPDLDPEGTPEPLRASKSNVGNTMTGFVGSRGFPPN